MKKKKIIMIILLFIMLSVLIIAIIKINNKSIEKISDNSKNNNIISNETTIEKTKATGKVRRSSKTVTADLNNLTEITDNYFIEQTNDIYLNLNDYLGKTIKIEGLIYSYEDENGDICYAVVRNTPGCCGTDGLAGIDIRYNENYPEENTWVEVIGVMDKDNIYGTEIPAIQVTSLTETEEGTTFVTN